MDRRTSFSRLVALALKRADSAVASGFGACIRTAPLAFGYSPLAWSSGPAAAARAFLPGDEL